MGWLDQIERLGKFKCNSCGHDYRVKLDPKISIKQTEDESECPSCQTAGSSEYYGFINSMDIGITKTVQRSTYEKNGRKAVRIGNTYMSKSKYNYLETGKVTEHYTKEYDQHTIKQEQDVKAKANQVVKGLRK